MGVELCKGVTVMGTRCYPFNMPKCQFDKYIIACFTILVPYLCHTYLDIDHSYLRVIFDICHVHYSQDTVLTVPPYRLVLDYPSDIPLEEC